MGCSVMMHTNYLLSVNGDNYFFVNPCNILANNYFCLVKDCLHNYAYLQTVDE